MAGAKPFVDSKLKQRKVMMFTKSYSPECKVVRDIMEQYKMPKDVYEVCEIECRQDCTQIENYFQIICLTDTRAVPQLFVDKKYVGGEKEIILMHESGELKRILSTAGAINV